VPVDRVLIYIALCRVFKNSLVAFSLCALLILAASGCKVVKDVNKQPLPSSHVDTTHAKKEPKWVLRNPRLTAADLSQAYFFDSMFVLIGYLQHWRNKTPLPSYDIIELTSTDGVSWKQIPLDTGFLVTNIVKGDGRYVAVKADGTSFTSTDAIRWRRNEFKTPESMHRIGYGNGLFVMVGDSGAIYASTDGIQWNRARSGTREPLFEVVYGSGMFYAHSYCKIYRSKSGKEWQELKQQDHPPCNINTLLISNSQLYVEVTDGLHRNDIYRSDSGEVWQLWSNHYINTPSNSFSIVKVTIKNEIDYLFAFVGCKGTVAISDNGQDWHMQDTLFDADLNSIAYGNERYVAVGNNGTVLTSKNILNDGFGWSWRNQAPPVDINAITYGGSRYVAVGNHGLIITSMNGLDWSVASFDSVTKFVSVAYGNGKFIVLGDNGCVKLSSDGISWVDSGFITPCNQRRLTSVTYGLGMFIAYGENSRQRSLDGKKWEECYGPPTGCKHIVFEKDKFIAATENEELYSSGDGTSWSFFASGGAQIDDFVFVDTLLIATNGNTLLIPKVPEEEGSEWSPLDPKQYKKYCKIKHGPIVIAGNDGKCLITDTLRYSIREEACTPAVINAMTYHNGRFVAVGQAGTIVTIEGE
jgi:hypothetical protein